MALPSEDATDQGLNPRGGFVPPAYQATAMEKATDDLRVEIGLKMLPMDRQTQLDERMTRMASQF